jgi:hypothetical protein
MSRWQLFEKYSLLDLWLHFQLLWDAIKAHGGIWCLIIVDDNIWADISRLRSLCVFLSLISPFPRTIIRPNFSSVFSEQVCSSQMSLRLENRLYGSLIILALHGTFIIYSLLDVTIANNWDFVSPRRVSRALSYTVHPPIPTTINLWTMREMTPLETNECCVQHEADQFSSRNNSIDVAAYKGWKRLIPLFSD